MVTTLLILFVAGYLMIALEHIVKVNKATFALIMCSVLWAVYAMMSHDATISSDLLDALGSTCEIVVFLLGAMIIVELVDSYGGFNIIISKIHAGSKRKLLWVLALVTFLLSSVLDNMTTTIIMVSLLSRLISDTKERWLFAGVIVIAANAGGVWSPIGDITTIMLWMKDYVSAANLLEHQVIPALASVVVPLIIASMMIKNTPVLQMQTTAGTVEEKGYDVNAQHPGLSRLMLICGIGGLLFAPVFKTVTHLAPFMGILLSLGILWLITEIVSRRYQLDGKFCSRVSDAVRQIDMSTILFFLGILMAVSALDQAGILSDLATTLNKKFHNVYIITGIIGILSSVVDNVPLVAACMEMYPVATESMIAAASDPAYTSLFVEDGLFWHLLTFTTGTGGSILIIGSAAGVVAMGIEKIPFIWYMKRITLLALAGYFAGMAMIWLEVLVGF